MDWPDVIDYWLINLTQEYIFIDVYTFSDSRKLAKTSCFLPYTTISSHMFGCLRQHQSSARLQTPYWWRHRWWYYWDSFYFICGKQQTRINFKCLSVSRYYNTIETLFLLALLMLPSVCCSFRSLYRSIKTQRLGGVFWEEVMIRPTLVTQWTLSSVQSCIKPTVNPERLRMARHNSTGSSNDKT